MRRLIIGATVICAMIGSAHAFQQSAEGGEQGQPAQATVGKRGGDAAQNLKLSPETLLPGAKSKDGTEVRIPGLGRLGVLPKLDFGLELLYGATEQPAKSDPALEGRSGESEDDLRIRGTFKHRF